MRTRGAFNCSDMAFNSASMRGASALAAPPCEPTAATHSGLRREPVGFPRLPASPMSGGTAARLPAAPASPPPVCGPFLPPAAVPLPRGLDRRRWLWRARRLLPPLSGLGLLRRVRNGRVVKEETARRNLDSVEFWMRVERPRGTPLEVLGRVIRAGAGWFVCLLSEARAGEHQRRYCDYDSFRCSGFCFHCVCSGLLCVFDLPAMFTG